MHQTARSDVLLLTDARRSFESLYTIACCKYNFVEIILKPFSHECEYKLKTKYKEIKTRKQ